MKSSRWSSPLPGRIPTGKRVIFPSIDGNARKSRVFYLECVAGSSLIDRSDFVESIQNRGVLGG
jgi:hypothetical protein